MRCVILQPSYIPWRGYFHQILKSETFVFLDDVPFDRRGWRNRNRIKGPDGVRWLTIPVLSKGTRSDSTPIRDIPISWDRDWNRSHRETIRHCYARAPHYNRYAGLLDDFYGRRPRLLADFTIELTIRLAEELGITGRRYIRSSDLPTRGQKTERLMSILTYVEATHYITGPSARDYLEEERFAAAGIGLEYMDYDYPDYPQLHGPFVPDVSILDLLLMAGDEAINFITSRQGWPIT